MDDKEKEVLKLTVELWNKFLELEPVHQDDQKEFKHNLHGIQNIILARPTQKELNKEPKKKYALL